MTPRRFEGNGPPPVPVVQRLGRAAIPTDYIEALRPKPHPDVLRCTPTHTARAAARSIDGVGLPDGSGSPVTAEHRIDRIRMVHLSPGRCA